jgi:hypothetical protein
MPDGEESWTVLDDAGEVVAPVEAFPKPWPGQILTCCPHQGLTALLRCGPDGRQLPASVGGARSVHSSAGARRYGEPLDHGPREGALIDLAQDHCASPAFRKGSMFAERPRNNMQALTTSVSSDDAPLDVALLVGSLGRHGVEYLVVGGVAAPKPRQAFAVGPRAAKGFG